METIILSYMKDGMQGSRFWFHNLDTVDQLLMFRYTRAWPLGRWGYIKSAAGFEITYAGP